jgi:hypothetical protein
MTSVHSKLVQSCQYALLKSTSQRHCISNVRRDPGYGLDAVTTWHGFASADGHKSAMCFLMSAQITHASMFILANRHPLPQLKPGSLSIGLCPKKHANYLTWHYFDKLSYLWWPTDDIQCTCAGYCSFVLIWAVFEVEKLGVIRSKYFIDIGNVYDGLVDILLHFKHQVWQNIPYRSSPHLLEFVAHPR